MNAHELIIYTEWLFHQWHFWVVISFSSIVSTFINAGT